MKDVNDLPRIVKEAFYIARSAASQEPVLIDIPRDVQTDHYTGPWPYSEVEMDLPGYNPPIEPDEARAKRWPKRSTRPARPLLYVGGGARDFWRIPRNCAPPPDAREFP